MDKISDLKEIVINTLDLNKAQDIVTIDLKDKSSMADYMIIASGTSSRHIQSLSEQGFMAPVIKEATAQQMWFLNNGIDYVGTFGLQGDVFVEKATFKPTFNNPGISFNPAGRNEKAKTREPRKDVETLNFDESDDF